MNLPANTVCSFRMMVAAFADGFKTVIGSGEMVHCRGSFGTGLYYDGGVVASVR